MTETRLVSTGQLRQLISSGQEYALIDPREEGEYSARHLFFACCLPPGRMELLLASRLPRLDVPVIVVSGGDFDRELSVQAAGKLIAAGYSDVAILAGGTDAWEADGGEIYAGVNVPSKAFGEFVEHWHDTPRLPAEKLAALQAESKDLVVLDSRPADEFRRMSIPGGLDCPGAELVYRMNQVVTDPDTIVVVNCAGRTRSIIGAQSLINAGVPNPVFALKDGTMGWKLSGLTLRHGETGAVADPGPEALAQASSRAEQVATRCGVTRIDAAGLAAWQADSSRSCFLLDVRTEAEYAAGHWPGAIHAPGGQLVQATDEYVMIRESRLVLCDNADGVRAILTAHWLMQLGWPEVRVFTEVPAKPVIGADAIVVAVPGRVQRISAAGFVAEPNAQLLDFSSSREYRQEHLTGAMWALRSRISACLEKARASRPGIQAWVVMAQDERLARLAAADILAIEPDANVSVLAGARPEWLEAGLSLSADEPVWLTEVNDVWPKPGEGSVDPKLAMEQYLSWEVGLVAQVEREGLARFRRLM